MRRMTKHKTSKSQVLKNSWQCCKDNEISKQKCLLVQVAGPHGKHKPVTNANYCDTSQSITKKRYLDACMKLVHTTRTS